MDTQHIDALLENLMPEEILRLAHNRIRARSVSGVLEKLSGLPELGIEQWSAVKEVLLDRGGSRIVEGIASEALAALMQDNQALFWRALLLTFRNVLAALPHLHPPPTAERTEEGTA